MSGCVIIIFLRIPQIIAAWKKTNRCELQLLNKLGVEEVELVLNLRSWVT